MARRNAPRLLGSAVALEAWRCQRGCAPRGFIDIVEGKVEDRGVALEELFQQVAEGAGLPAGVADRLPPEVASLTVAKPDEVETVQNLVELFETLVWVLLALAIAGFAGAIELSPDRRRAVVRVGGWLMFAALLVLAARRLGERWVMDTLAEAPNANAAADDVWEISTSLLAEVAQGSFLIGLFIVAGAWLRRRRPPRGRAAPILRLFDARAPGASPAPGSASIILLVIWGPVPWTQRPGRSSYSRSARSCGSEWIKRRIVAEFPDEPPPRLAWRRPRTAT